jgi:hypothetical protein
MRVMDVSVPEGSISFVPDHAVGEVSAHGGPKLRPAVAGPQSHSAGECCQQDDDQQGQGERAEAIAAAVWSLRAPIDEFDLHMDPPRSSAPFGWLWRQDGDGGLTVGRAVERHRTPAIAKASG